VGSGRSYIVSSAEISFPWSVLYCTFTVLNCTVLYCVLGFEYSGLLNLLVHRFIKGLYYAPMTLLVCSVQFGPLEGALFARLWVRTSAQARLYWVRVAFCFFQTHECVMQYSILSCNRRAAQCSVALEDGFC